MGRLNGGCASLILLMAIMSCSLGKCFAEDLRIMTYNVRNGIGLDKKYDAKRIGDIVSREYPEVVAIQELDSATNRSGGKDVLAEIASNAGMQYVYAPAISYDGGKYGIGILCREKPMSVQRVQLPGREEERMMVVAEFPEYSFACTHLSLTDEDRMLSIPLIIEEAQKSDKPFFLAGDFNAHPDDDFMRELSKNFTILCETEEFSFPADKPDERLDYIVVFNRNADHVSPVKSRVLNEPVASDHRPVIADVKL